VKGRRQTKQKHNTENYNVEQHGHHQNRGWSQVLTN